MDVVIVILCWRFEKCLPELLRSIANQKSKYRFTTVVCHNSPAPSGHILEPVDMSQMSVNRIFTGGNLGFGGGNNFGILWAKRHFDPRYFLCLNSDVVLTDGALDAMLGWADANTGMAIIGAVHTAPGDPRLNRGCRYDPVLSRIRHVYGKESQRIDYVNGGCILIRASVFSGNPVFFDGYFLFFEELELAVRIKSMGYETGCCPNCIVIHQEGTTRNSVTADDYCPEVSEYFENLNVLRFTRDHHPHCLPTVLISRFFGKFIWLLIKGEFQRLIFWFLAMTDFCRGQIRRFPFQEGWCPAIGKDKVINSNFPFRLR